jgi:hypothetical protein
MEWAVMLPTFKASCIYRSYSNRLNYFIFYFQQPIVSFIAKKVRNWNLKINKRKFTSCFLDVDPEIISHVPRNPWKRFAV